MKKKKNIFNPVTLLQFDLKYYMCILICKSYSYCLAWNKDVNYRKTKLKPGVKKSKENKKNSYTLLKLRRKLRIFWKGEISKRIAYFKKEGDINEKRYEEIFLRSYGAH